MTRHRERCELVCMSITEAEQQAIEEKRRCFSALKEVAETAIAEGLAERFDDALVDFAASARFIDKRIGTDATLRRIGALINQEASKRN